MLSPNLATRWRHFPSVDSEHHILMLIPASTHINCLENGSTKYMVTFKHGNLAEELLVFLSLLIV